MSPPPRLVAVVAVVALVALVAVEALPFNAPLNVVADIELRAGLHVILESTFTDFNPGVLESTQETK